MKVLAVYNLKGGVGKTTTAVNLAYLSARDGERTLLWDLDAQAAATFCLRVKPRIPGGTKSLLEGRGALERAIRGSDYPGWTYSRPSSRPATWTCSSRRPSDPGSASDSCCAPRRRPTISVCWIAHRASHWSPRTSFAPRTSCSSR